METEATTTTQAPEPKFERRGFSATAAAPKEEPVTQEAVTEEPVTSGELPTEFSFESPESEATPGETAQEAAAPETETEAEYKIGDRTFRTQKEAWSYAEELERERLAADAFRQGVEAAQVSQKGNQNAASPQPEPEEEIPVDVMYDPKKLAKWVSDKAEKAKERAKAELRAESDRQTKHNQTWSEFYNDYPDLNNKASRRIVDSVLQENWGTLAPLETKRALKIVADKARAELKESQLSMAPGQELPRTKQVTSVSTGRVVTKGKTEEKPLNFVQQLRSMKAKRAGGRK